MNCYQLIIVLSLECAPSWELIGTRCYKLYNNNTNYDSAASACRNNGAVLASLVSREHQAKINVSEMNMFYICMSTNFG